MAKVRLNIRGHVGIETFSVDDMNTLNRDFTLIVLQSHCENPDSLPVGYACSKSRRKRMEIES